MSEKVQDDFCETWVAIEQFFTDLVENYAGWNQCRPMLELIAKFQECEYDASFRAGQSLHYLVISRAAKHGLQEFDPSISFFSAGDGKFNLRYWNARQQLTQYDFVLDEFDLRTDNCIQQLLLHPIH